MRGVEIAGLRFERAVQDTKHLEKSCQCRPGADLDSERGNFKLFWPFILALAFEN